MEKIRREIRLFWTRNGKLLLQIIGTIALIILAIQGLNQYTILKNKEEAEKKLINQEKIEKEKKKKKEIEKDKETISKFINYCNEKKINEAYKMLSEDCKKTKYLTITDFEEKYIKKIFEYKKDYEISLQENNTYKIVFLEDILQAGSTEKRNKLEDYYSIKEDVLGDKTININLNDSI